MRWRRIGLWVGIAAAMVVESGCLAQDAPSSAVQNLLHSMSNRAAVVFVGSVTRIQKVEGEGSSSGVVEVTFQVDQAVRGVGAGSTYTLREWSGLWMASDRRYSVGERLLMLLNAPGAGGLSSPVGGMEGAIPVHGIATSGGNAASGSAVVDLRWLQARVPRQITYAPPSLEGAHGTPPHGASARIAGDDPSASVPSSEEMKSADQSTTCQLGVLSVLRILAVRSNDDAR